MNWSFIECTQSYSNLNLNPNKNDVRCFIAQDAKGKSPIAMLTALATKGASTRGPLPFYITSGTGIEGAQRGETVRHQRGGHVGRGERGHRGAPQAAREAARELRGGQYLRHLLAQARDAGGDRHGPLGGEEQGAHGTGHVAA